MDCQEKPVGLRNGDPKRGGIPHILHECAFAPSIDHRMTQISSATTNQLHQIHEEDNIDISSAEEEHPDVLSRMLKGKGKVVSDFPIQDATPKNNPS